MNVGEKLAKLGIQRRKEQPKPITLTPYHLGEILAFSSEKTPKLPFTFLMVFLILRKKILRKKNG